jgi:integrase
VSATPEAPNRALALLSAIWNWAAGREEASKAANPAQGIEHYPERTLERYLSMDELHRPGNALREGETKGLPWATNESKPTAKHIPKTRKLTKMDPYAVATIRLLILTGARLREILHAKWDYVDWDRGLLLLPDSKTGRKTIYLSAPALTVLQALPRSGANPFIIPGLTKPPKNTTAKNVGKEPVPKPRADLKKPWAAVARVAGLTGVRLHDLRHSFAATGAGASLGLPMIGKLLGHAQPATTARYAHLDPDPMHRAANMIGNQIAAAMDGKMGRVLKNKTFRIGWWHSSYLDPPQLPNGLGVPSVTTCTSCASACMENELRPAVLEAYAA